MIRNIATDAQGMTSNAFLVSGRPAARAPAEADDGDTGRRVLVDCGANFDVESVVREHVETLDAVVLTHTHPDHIGTLPAVREAFDIETWGFDPSHSAVDRELPDGGTTDLGLGEFEAIHTPGHKNDHVCLHDEQSGTLFAGDLVFANGAFGRTDLEEGDRDALIESIERVRERVAGNLSAVHVGHGPSITQTPENDLELAGQAARMR